MRIAKQNLWIFIFIIPYLLLVKKLWFVCDDAYISFTFARNFAAGLGLVFNPGWAPIAGYSNLLWVLIASFFEFCQIASPSIMPILSALIGTCLLIKFYNLLKNHYQFSLQLSISGALLLAIFPCFAAWSSSGMETIFFAFCILLCFELIVLKKINCLTILPVSGLILLRPEGFIWLLGIIGCKILTDFLQKNGFEKKILLPLITGIIIFSLYLSFNYYYYQSLLPNTVSTKSGLSLATIDRGFSYVFTHFLSFLSPLIILLFFFIKNKLLALPSLVISLGTIAYSIIVGGDFMAMSRFLVPMIPFQVIIFLLFISEKFTNKIIISIILPNRINM